MSLIEKIFSQKQNSKLPEIEINNMLELFEVWNVLDLEQALKDENLYWVSFVSKNVKNSTQQIIESLACYIFDSSTRIRNLWIHIDSPDRIETSDMILTWLYSPTNSYSNIATIFTDTKKSDRESKKFIENFRYKENFSEEFEEIKKQILDIFKLSIKNVSEDSMWFWTCMCNVCFAHRWLKKTQWNKLLEARDQFVKQFLIDSRNSIELCFTKKREESILIFPNWLTNNWRHVSHTRFSTLDEKDRFSNWKISNICFDENGKVRPANTKIISPNDKILINRWWINMWFRSSINPLI